MGEGGEEFGSEEVEEEREVAEQAKGVLFEVVVSEGTSPSASASSATAS